MYLYQDWEVGKKSQRKLAVARPFLRGPLPGCTLPPAAQHRTYDNRNSEILYTCAVYICWRCAMQRAAQSSDIARFFFDAMYSVALDGFVL